MFLFLSSSDTVFTQVKNAGTSYHFKGRNVYCVNTVCRTESEVYRFTIPCQNCGPCVCSTLHGSLPTLLNDFFYFSNKPSSRTTSSSSSPRTNKTSAFEWPLPRCFWFIWVDSPPRKNEFRTNNIPNRTFQNGNHPPYLIFSPTFLFSIFRFPPEFFAPIENHSCLINSPRKKRKSYPLLNKYSCDFLLVRFLFTCY